MSHPHHELSGSVVVNGVRCDPVTGSRVPRTLGAFISCGRSHVVNFLSADPTVIAMSDRAYRATLNRGDLNVADGMPVVWAMRLAGVRTMRVAGADAMLELTRWAAQEGHAAYLYGGEPGVAQRLRERLEVEVPTASFAGVESPPFAPTDVEELAMTAERIRASGAALLWVGLGTPKQHIVADRLRAGGAAPVILCVGAAFDFVSGAKRRPSRWMQRAGLEWFGRLVDEPGRLWRRYLLGNVRFVAGVARERVRAL